MRERTIHLSILRFPTKMVIIEKLFFIILIFLLGCILSGISQFLYYPGYEMAGVAVHGLIAIGMYEFIRKMGILQIFPILKNLDDSYQKLKSLAYEFTIGAVLSVIHYGSWSIILVIFLAICVGLIVFTITFVSSMTPITLIILLLIYIAFIKK